MSTISSKPKSSFIKKSFIALVFLTILYYILYNVCRHITLTFYTTLTSYETLTSSKTFTSHTKLPFISLQSSTQISYDSCRLSLNESDGWFCESDNDWERRKRLHHIQDKRNHNSNSRDAFFGTNWEPTIQCTFERRLGNTGDGGKWVCDIHHLQRNNSTPLIYSFGSNGDFSFEQAIKQELPKSEIHTFDLRAFKCPSNLCIFHRVRLGDGKRKNTKSLQEIIDELGHRQRQIDILKIDIDGSEYMLFEEHFKQSKNTNKDDNNNNNKQNRTEIPYIRQILIEVHLGHGKDPEPVLLAHKLFESFRSNNYAIFHKEVNLHDARNVFEYAFIRLNPVFFILSL